VSTVLALIASGESIDQVVRAYSLSHLTPEAVKEAIRLADKALVQSAQMLMLDQVYEQESSSIDPLLFQMQVASLTAETW
jgi:DNA polymerase III delta prime subunit